MSHLFVFRRPAVEELFVSRTMHAPGGWEFRGAVRVNWAPADGTVPYVLWRRRGLEPAHAFTTGDRPAADGHWTVQSVVYAEPHLEAVPVHRPAPPTSIPFAEQLSLVRPLFLEALDLLNAHDFPYWADSGTLLGAMRHRGIIPWDKDCDLGIRRTDRRAFLKLIRGAPGFDVWYDTGPTMWIVSTKYQVRVSDVFTYTRMRRFRAAFWERNAARYRVDVSQGYLLYDQRMFRSYCEQRFNIPWSLFDPVRWAPFYDRRIKVANRARTLLKGMYGEKCFTHASTNTMNSEGAAITCFAPL